MKYLIDHYIENPTDHFSYRKYLKKIEHDVNNYVNSHVICDDIDFN